MLNRLRDLQTGRAIANTVCRVVILTSACVLATADVVRADWSAKLLPVVAQAQKTTTAEPAAEGVSWPILDWLIVGVLIGAAIFVICRSSRRN
jgi:hypothetical protein